MEHDHEHVVNCSAVDKDQFVGPVQVYASIYGWNTAVYIVLGLHATALWVISGRVIISLKSTCDPKLWFNLLLVTLVPPLLLVLYTLGIVIPTTGPFVQLLGDIVISIGMVQFIMFTTKLAGGSKNLVQRCTDTKTRLPIQAPPFFCLAVLKQPMVTKRKLTTIQVLPVILIILKTSLLLVRIYEAKTLPFAEEPISELARPLSIPVALVGVYTYTIYLMLVAQVLKSNAKTLGFVLLGLFILSDAVELFFLFMKGAKMLTCIAPAMPLWSVIHLLKNCIKGFIVFAAGLPYLKICAEKQYVLQM